MRPSAFQAFPGIVASMLAVGEPQPAHPLGGEPDPLQEAAMLPCC